MCPCMCAFFTTICVISQMSMIITYYLWKIVLKVLLLFIFRIFALGMKYFKQKKTENKKYSLSHRPSLTCIILFSQKYKDDLILSKL